MRTEEVVDPGRVEAVRRRGRVWDFAGIAQIGVQRIGVWCGTGTLAVALRPFGVEVAAVGLSQRYTCHMIAQCLLAVWFSFF